LRLQNYSKFLNWQNFIAFYCRFSLLCSVFSEKIVIFAPQYGF